MYISVSNHIRLLIELSECIKKYKNVNIQNINMILYSLSGNSLFLTCLKFFSSCYLTTFAGETGATGPSGPSGPPGAGGMYNKLPLVINLT